MSRCDRIALRKGGADAVRLRHAQVRERNVSVGGRPVLDVPLRLPVAHHQQAMGEPHQLFGEATEAQGLRAVTIC